jgi:CrcB protein
MAGMPTVGLKHRQPRRTDRQGPHGLNRVHCQWTCAAPGIRSLVDASRLQPRTRRCRPALSARAREAGVSVGGLLAVSIGGALGCLLRWSLAQWLNPMLPALPLGTLAANLLGGLLMGCALALMEHFQSVPTEWRLFATTGFLGGLTTFSTFSAESTVLLLRQQYLWFGGHIAANLVGSIGMTVLGLGALRSVLRAGG